MNLHRCGLHEEHNRWKKSTTRQTQQHGKGERRARVVPHADSTRSRTRLVYKTRSAPLPSPRRQTPPLLTLQEEEDVTDYGKKRIKDGGDGMRSWAPAFAWQRVPLPFGFVAESRQRVALFRRLIPFFLCVLRLGSSSSGGRRSRRRWRYSTRGGFASATPQRCKSVVSLSSSSILSCFL